MNHREMSDLYEQALTLEPASRWSLAEQLLASVPVGTDLENERFWRSEVSGRLAELRSGAVSPIPWEDAMASVENIIRE